MANQIAKSINLEPEFGIELPEPGTLLSQIVIHPANVENERRHQIATPLSKNLLKKYKGELKYHEKYLNHVEFFALQSRYDDLRTKITNLMEQRAQLMTIYESEDCSDKLRFSRAIARCNIKIKQTAERAHEIGFQRALHMTEYRRYRQIQSRLELHQIAIEENRLRDLAYEGLKVEARDIHDLIVSTLSQLGHVEEYSHKGKTYWRKIEMQEIHIMPDGFYFKILTAEKRIFGWQNVMPSRVNPKRLVDEDTVFALQTVLQRSVRAISTRHNGIWYHVDRFGSVDGLPMLVKYHEMMRYYNHQRSRMSIPLGVTEGKTMIWLDLAEYPHGLIAGSTGSGKSTVQNMIISTLIANHSPDDLRLVLVDMKDGTEFGKFEDMAIPHLLGNVITTAGDFYDMLVRLEQLRAERGALLRKVYAKKLDEYNRRVPESQRMPRIFVIIDEYNAIKNDDPRKSDTENSRIERGIKRYVSQLLSKARSAGIHLIITSQAPYVELVPGTDKANLSYRLVGRLNSSATSRAIIESSDAYQIDEDMKGRMLLAVGGTIRLVQTPLITEDEIDHAIEVAKSYTPKIYLQLPETPVEIAGLSDDYVVDLALREYGGRMSSRKMWDDGVKDAGLISWRDFNDMVKRICDAESLQHNGVVYTLENAVGGGKKLVNS